VADIKIRYPSTSSVDLTISLTSLAANGSAGVFTVGRASTAENNTTNLDLDHLLSGVIRTGTTTPVAGRSINVYAYASYITVTGTPTYPDSITGTDAAKTMTSANVQNSALKFVASITIDATAERDYVIAPVSIASIFGGVLPKFWGIFVAHDTGSNLSATGGACKLSYERIQSQTV
jgi:hypothetical protein